MTIILNGHIWKYSEFLENKRFSFNKKKILNLLSKKDIEVAYSIISSWKDYFPTPLIELHKLSKELNINKIFYKDESKRFDLKSFKALGGAYAVEKISKGKNIATIKGEIYNQSGKIAATLIHNAFLISTKLKLNN